LDNQRRAGRPDQHHLAMGPAFLAAAESSAQEKEKPQRSAAEKEAIAKLTKLNVIVLDIAQNDPHLDVSYLQKDAKFSDDFLTPLKDLKGSLELLNLTQPRVVEEIHADYLNAGADVVDRVCCR
jgi:citrate synthase